MVEGQLASISVFDDGLLRGDGVFEVLRLYAGKPWALDEHLERMALSARNMRLEFTLSDIAHDIDLLLSQIGPMDVWLRLVVTRGGRRIALIEEIPPAPATIALATVEYATAPLMHAIKSLSYAPNMLAVRIAREQGADDALFVTADGRVLEASRASFFYVLGSTLYTPPLDGVLDSITRRHLLAATDARERTTTRDDLNDIS
ncbi:MAG: aminotransferase class IV, partial [Chloroflexota bacterium]|nr:aminotransferase class IV [Chloroflexota bacterium]